MTMKITLDLTPREIELLRSSTSDLGISDKDCVTLRLKIANAILDTKPKHGEWQYNPAFVDSATKMPYKQDNNNPTRRRDPYSSRNNSGF